MLIDRIKFFKASTDKFYFYFVVFLILIAIFFENRSLTIGFSFGLLIFHLFRKKRKPTSANLFYICFAFIFVLLIAVFLFKTDSSKGRIFIYNLSFNILMESFPKGIGIGNFDVAYGNEQIAYFRRGNYSMKEFLLADNIRHAYNDYLEIIIEWGIVGVLLVAGWIYTIGFLINRALKQPLQSQMLLPIAVILLIALSVASLFTFMIYQIHWQMLTVACLAIVVYYGQYRYKRFLTITCVFVFISLIVFHFGKRIIYQEDYQKMEEAVQLSKAGYYEDADKLYQEIEKKLNTNPDFLSSYSYHLILRGKPSLAEPYLKKLLKEDNNSLNQDLLALCYKQQKKYDLAEAGYLNAIYKVPNRFTSRYKLFLMYILLGENKKAKQLGEFILEMPVKVPSAVVDYYKLSVGTELKKINKELH